MVFRLFHRASRRPRRGLAAWIALVAGLVLALNVPEAAADPHLGLAGGDTKVVAADVGGAPDQPEPSKVPALQRGACTGHCVTHMASLPQRAAEMMTGRVEVTVWALDPAPRPACVDADAPERPPRI